MSSAENITQSTKPRVIKHPICHSEQLVRGTYKIYLFSAKTSVYLDIYVILNVDYWWV